MVTAPGPMFLAGKWPVCHSVTPGLGGQSRAGPGTGASDQCVSSPRGSGQPPELRTPADVSRERVTRRVRAVTACTTHLVRGSAAGHPGASGAA